MRDKKHLTENGLQRIISIRALMNKKTSITSYTYPLIVIDVPVLPPLKTTDLTPEWLAGFTDAEGCFFLNLRENKSKKGYWVTARFSLV
jgi:LAGLIDADG endonuclease